MNITTPFDSEIRRAAALDQDVGLVAIDLPAALLDATTCVPLAVNPAAAAFLGIDPARLADIAASMPAWAAIRAFAAGGPSTAARREHLLFWTPKGPQACLTELELITSGGRQLVRIVMPGAAPRAHRAAMPSADARDKDLATLREIARRIKEGMAAEVMAPAVAPKLALPAALPGQPLRVAVPRPPPLDFRQLPTAGPDLQDSSAAAQQGGLALAPDELAKFAHELRTPLSAIVSLAEIMRDERLGQLGSERYKAYAGDIYDSAQHTLDLVSAMLQARAESQFGSYEANDAAPPSSLAMTFDRVDLGAIGRGCVSAMQPIGGRGDVSMVAEAVTEPMIVLADRRAVRQMMFNVLSNALRFTPAGGTITLSVGHRVGGGIEIAVTDTGAGMRPVDIARILATTPGAAGPAPIRIAGGHPGAGIGLPLVRQLIEAHGGALSIDSVAGRGTRVSLLFPSDRVVRP